MASQAEPERPHISEHGAWPSTSANSFRQQYLLPADETSAHEHLSPEIASITSSPLAPVVANDANPASNTDILMSTTNGSDPVSSGEPTAIPSPADSHYGANAAAAVDRRTPSEKELMEQEKADAARQLHPTNNLLAQEWNRVVRAKSLKTTSSEL